MKKLISCIMILALTVTLVACNSSSPTDISSNNNASVSDNEDSKPNVEQFDKNVEDGETVKEDNNGGSSNTESNKGVSSTNTTSGASSSDKNSEETKTYEQYEELNKTNPVQGKSEWVFRSTDKDYIAPYDKSELSECCITIDESDHAIITWNYYYDLANHPEYQNSDDKKIKYDNKNYCWFLCYKYEGTCFVEQNGILTIQLKCTNDLGEYVNDEIGFKREGADKLVVISHSGTEFNLFKGDEFTR